MNLKLANYEDLLATYYDGCPARKAAKKLGYLVRRGDQLQLASLLRDYRERGVYSRREIELRAATDSLMNCCSAMEIASLAYFVPTQLEETEFGKSVVRILENKQVRRYYEDFYPTKLPQLFRYRLLNGRGVTEDRDPSDLNKIMMAFLDLDRRFVADLDDGYLLRMLDGFTIDGYSFKDVIDVIAKPKQFVQHLLYSEKDRTALSAAIHEFSLFMQFCFDLQGLLKLADRQPLIQSAIWNQYGYWFDILGDKLRTQLGRAVTSFLGWEPAGKSGNALEAVQKYVAEARTVLDTLTSRQFSEPVDRVIESMRRSS